MARILAAFFAAPFVVFVILALVGDGVTSAVLGLAVAGALGGLVAWFAFGSAHPNVPDLAKRPQDDPVVVLVELRVLNAPGETRRNRGGESVQKTLIHG